MPGWLDSGPTLTPDQTRLTDLHLVGNYAVSPHWADGHKTGLLPLRAAPRPLPVRCAHGALAPLDANRPARPRRARHDEHR